MRDLVKDVKNEIKTIRNDIRLAEEKKSNSLARSKRFIEERKAASQTQKRIDAVRRSIQRKPQ